MDYVVAVERLHAVPRTPDLSLEPHVPDFDQTAFAELTTEVVAAYVAKNHVQPGELPGLIASVHDAFKGISKPGVVEPSAEPQKPFVPIKKSVTGEFIISLEDGRKMKSMKRYLSGLGMTPHGYRTKWGLPANYPMVAPAYAAKRSELAKTIGLGRKSQEEAVEAAPQPEIKPEPAAKKLGRRGAKKA